MFASILFSLSADKYISMYANGATVLRSVCNVTAFLGARNFGANLYAYTSPNRCVSVINLTQLCSESHPFDLIVLGHVTPPAHRPHNRICSRGQNAEAPGGEYGRKHEKAATAAGNATCSKSKRPRGSGRVSGRVGVDERRWVDLKATSQTELGPSLQVHQAGRQPRWPGRT
jgi:hypothetical protein